MPRSALLESLAVFGRADNEQSSRWSKAVKRVTYQYAVTSFNRNGESVVSNIAQGCNSALPPGPGRDVTIRVCSRCHSPALAASEKLSAQGWHDLVQRMVARGAVGTVDELNQATLYVSKSFPKEESTRKENK